MKKFLAISVFFTLAYSALVASELTVSMFDNSKIYIKFDGQRYNTYASAVSLSDVLPGNHRLEVYFYKSIRDYSNDWPTKAFSGFISIAPNSRVFGVIDEFYSFKVVRAEPISNNSYGNAYNNGYGNGWDNYNSNSNYGSYSYNTGANYSTYGYSEGNYNSPFPATGMYSNGYGMSNETFCALKATMNGSSFDSNKLNIARNAIRMNGVYSSQLYELMLMLSFDSNRLELAKFAYPFVVDKGSFFVVSNAFTFSSSADELFNYVGGY